MANLGDNRPHFLLKRLVSAARILQSNFLDHIIVGQAMVAGRGFFTFQEAALLQLGEARGG